MNALASGWFTEICPPYVEENQSEVGEHAAVSKANSNNHAGDGGRPHPSTLCGNIWQGMALSMKIEKELYHKRSAYQDIQVFRSSTFGNVLVLDGMIQCTERDECSYQEMLAHLPMMSHPNPKKVLIIGGGDGGILREVVKHESVESATLCEIDEDVINVSKEYLPHMASGFFHPKSIVHVGDGFEFMKNHQNEFDVIITDSSDPVGPAESLFNESYYKLLRSALTDTGVLASQAESVWLHLPLIKKMVTFCRELFPVVAYASSSVPTYPSGVIGYLICSKNPNCNPYQPRTNWSRADLRRLQLHYYNTDVHKAAFVLPEFVNEALSLPESK